MSFMFFPVSIPPTDPGRHVIVHEVQSVGVPLPVRDGSRT